DREAIQKMRIARDVGAQGVLVGVPFYFPSSVENAVRFYHDIAERFPSLAIMVYHNPVLHNVTIPVAASNKLVQIPNVVAMKDSHRETRPFMQLQQILRCTITCLVTQGQYPPYAQLGAPGCWSIDAWMGPWPLLRLRDAIAAGDTQTATEITIAIGAEGEGPPDLRWRETAAK